MEQKAILVQSISRRFGTLQAVRNLSFNVEPGEIFGLLGPNGAGKTTTVNLIIGMLRKDQGKILVLGMDPETKPREIRKRVGLVPQETNLYLDLSGLDNLWHHAALYCDDLSAVEGKMKQLLSMMNVWERREDKVRTYSTGMKRRLALARALLHDPEIILFDEPTLGVDVQGKHALWSYIKELQSKGKTFIVSTNDMLEADMLCDRLVIIDHGEAIARGSPDNLKAQLGYDIVTLRTDPPIEDPERVFEGMQLTNVLRPEPDMLHFEMAQAEHLAGNFIACVTAQHRLQSIRIARPSLDDVFLHHTGRGLRD
jgi:ABC-type multidrug transport system ATPase subunit